MQRASFPPIYAGAPNTYSTRERGVAMRRLRCSCVSEMPRFALDVRAPAGVGQVLFALGARVAAICIHIAAGIGRIEQHFEHGGVGDGSVGWTRRILSDFTPSRYFHRLLWGLRSTEELPLLTGFAKAAVRCGSPGSLPVGVEGF